MQWWNEKVQLLYYLFFLSFSIFSLGEIAVANHYNYHFKLIGTNLIGILNHVKKNLILFTFANIPLLDQNIIKGVLP